MQNELPKSNNIDMVSYGEAYAIPTARISNVEGRILTLLEGMGLLPTQERAIKSLIKSELWSLTEFPSAYRISGVKNMWLRKELVVDAELGNKIGSN